MKTLYVLVLLDYTKTVLLDYAEIVVLVDGLVSVICILLPSQSLQSVLWLGLWLFVFWVVLVFWLFDFELFSMYFWDLVFSNVTLGCDYWSLIKSADSKKKKSIEYSTSISFSFWCQVDKLWTNNILLR